MLFVYFNTFFNVFWDIYIRADTYFLDRLALQILLRFVSFLTRNISICDIVRILRNGGTWHDGMCICNKRHYELHTMAINGVYTPFLVTQCRFSSICAPEIHFQHFRFFRYSISFIDFVAF